MAVSRAVIKYPGAKWSIARWIIGHFPQHHSYLEPFFGSGAVLFTKERSHIETINDRDGDIVNLFQWIRNDPERLAREIYLTPYARDIYDKAWDAQYTETDSFQRAVDFCARMMMGHGYRTTGEKVGWKNDVQGRETAYAAKYWGSMPEVIIEAAERLRGAQIENRPAVPISTHSLMGDNRRAETLDALRTEGKRFLRATRPRPVYQATPYADFSCLRGVCQEGIRMERLMLWRLKTEFS